MADDSERDEQITEQRIAGASVRALAKQYGCSGREVEAAIDRRLDFTLDNLALLRAVKVSVARCERLLMVFIEKALKGDSQAGLLCVKIEERLALLLGTERSRSNVQRVDVYQIEQQQQPSSYEKITRVLMSLKHGPNGDGVPSADDQNGSSSEPFSMADDRERGPDGG